MIRLITTIAILILVLSFFGISIRSILESPTGKDNLTFVFEIIHTGWSVIHGYIMSVYYNLQSIVSLVSSK